MNIQVCVEVLLPGVESETRQLSLSPTQTKQTAAARAGGSATALAR